MYEIKKADNPEEYDRIVFVCKARLKESLTNPFLTVLHVERAKSGSRLIATDGKRLHVAEIGRRIKSGNYRPVISKDCVSFGEPVANIVYPNWEKTVPAKARKRLIVDLKKVGMGRDKKCTASLSRTFNTFIRKTGELVNLGYLDDLPKTIWTVYKEPGKWKSLLLKQTQAGRDAFAVLAPIKEAA